MRTRRIRNDKACVSRFCGISRGSAVNLPGNAQAAAVTPNNSLNSTFLISTGIGPCVWLLSGACRLRNRMPFRSRPFSVTKLQNIFSSFKSLPISYSSRFPAGLSPECPDVTYAVRERGLGSPLPPSRAAPPLGRGPGARDGPGQQVSSPLHQLHQASQTIQISRVGLC
jgi:hypothetical protein